MMTDKKYQSSLTKEKHKRLIICQIVSVIMLTGGAAASLILHDWLKGLAASILLILLCIALVVTWYGLIQFRHLISRHYEADVTDLAKSVDTAFLGAFACSVLSLAASLLEQSPVSQWLLASLIGGVILALICRTIRSSYLMIHK